MTKKIHYLTLTPKWRGLRCHKMLLSTLDIMWPMRQQSLMLLHPMVKEKMHLQENKLFNLDLWVKVTQNVAQYPRHHVTYAPAKFDTAHPKVKEMHLQENTLFDLDLRVKDTRNVAQCPLHYLCYKVWSDFVKRFRRKSIYKKIQYWPVPSTSCVMWPIQLQSLMLLCQKV